MCGIAGIVQIRESKDDASKPLVDSMIRLMAHRGPDSSGVAVLGKAVIGACRLAILGLDSLSNQPLRSTDSDCVIVFNGEIYNYHELREELAELGHTFRSEGDTEVVVHAYEEWAEDCLSHFNGMFAFAVVRIESPMVFLARDRFGVKPLYYALTDAGLIFASDVRAILSTRMVKPELDECSVIDFLRFGITDYSERTFFRSVRHLPPGFCGTFSRGQLTMKRWYEIEERLTRPGLEYRSPPPTEFQRLFGDSIRLRLRSDVPLGVLLSGGLDSSSITGVAARLLEPQPVECFNVSFPNSPVDEAAYAETVASYAKAELHVSEARRLDNARVAECVRAQGEPFISPSIVAQWLVMEGVKDAGIRVLLSGQGADEYLCGYDYFDGYALRDMMHDWRWREACAHLLGQPSVRSTLRVLREWAYLLLPTTLQGLAWRRTWLCDDRHQLESCDYWHALTGAKSLRDAQLMHLKWRLPELLRYEDRNSMAFSIETRQPFLDFRLVEYVLSLNNALLVARGFRKRLLRDSMIGVVPGSVLHRRNKIGFQTPEAWTRTIQFRDCLLGLLAQAPAPLREILRVGDIRRLALSRLRRHRERELWRIFCLLLWYREVVEDM